jgi:hypothetical protein
MAHGSDAELLNADQPAKRVRLHMYHLAGVWPDLASSVCPAVQQVSTLCADGVGCSLRLSPVPMQRRHSGGGGGGRGTPSDADEDIELVLSESPDDAGPGGSGAQVMCAVLWHVCFVNDVCYSTGPASVTCCCQSWSLAPRL